MDLTDILLGDQLFKNCSKEQVKAFLSRTFYRLRRRPYDCYVAYMGDACNDIIMLVEGTVYTSMVSDKKEVVIETIQAPSMLAPAFIYGGKNSFPVNVITKTSCTFLYINKALFLQLLSNDSTVMTNFIRILSDRCFRLSKRVHKDNLYSLKERAIDYINKVGAINNINWASRQLGVARPSLSRVISELRKEGAVMNTPEGIILKKE